VLRNKHVSNHLKGEVYKALVLSTLLYECEIWCLREDLFNRLRSFHKRCVRSMCRVSLHHAFHCHISSATLFQRLNVMDLDSYYHNWILCWAGHVARIPVTRAPRQLLTGWVAHSRPNGCPELTWGRTLNKALKNEGLPANFKEWRAIAEDRSGLRLRAYSKLMPPSENYPVGFMRVKMNISLRKRALSLVRLVLEDSSKRSYFLFVCCCYWGV